MVKLLVRQGERITIRCPEQERVKRAIEQERVEDIRNNATERHSRIQVRRLNEVKNNQI